MVALIAEPPNAIKTIRQTPASMPVGDRTEYRHYPLTEVDHRQHSDLSQQ